MLEKYWQEIILLLKTFCDFSQFIEEVLVPQH